MKIYIKKHRDEEIPPRFREQNYKVQGYFQGCHEMWIPIEAGILVEKENHRKSKERQNKLKAGSRLVVVC